MSSPAKTSQGGGAACTVADRDRQGIQEDNTHAQAGVREMHEHEVGVVCNKSNARAASIAHDDIISYALAAIVATDGDEADVLVDDFESASLGDDGACRVRSFGDQKKWGDFCSRVESGKAWPSCVIDFAYEDRGKGGLNLEGDQRLVERMYCFHDPQCGPGDQHLVVVHAHTVMTWGERLAAPGPVRMDEFTSVNACHASKKSGGVFAQETHKFYIVPGSKDLIHQWRSLFQSGKKHTLVWKLDKKGSMPGKEDAKFCSDYDTVRRALVKGESLCHEAAITTSIKHTQKIMRGGHAAEYIVAGVSLPPATCSTSLERKHPVEVFPTCAPTPPPQRPTIMFLGINTSGQAALSVQEEFRS